MLKTQSEVRAAFWDAFEGYPNIRRRKIPDYSGKGTMHDTDTRCAFVDYVDALARDGQITEALAQRVTL